MNNEMLKQAHRDNLKEVKEQAKKDGIRNIPKDGASAYEGKIRSFYQALISKLNLNLIEDLKECSKEMISKAKAELQYLKKINVKTEISELTKEHKDKVQRLEDNADNDKKQLYNDEIYMKAKNDFEEADEKFVAITKTLRRASTDVRYSKWLYLLLIPIIAGEIFLNYGILDIILAEEPFIVYIQAGIISLGVLACAHVVGKGLRQRTYGALFITCLAAGLGVIISIPWIRGGEGSNAAGHEMDWPDYLFFLSVGLALFAIGAAVSYFRNDSSRLFVVRKERYDATKKEYDQLEKDLIAEKKSIGKTFENNLYELKSNYKQACNDVTAAVTKKQSVIDRRIAEQKDVIAFYNNEKIQCNEYYEEAINLYRSENDTHNEKINKWKNITKLNLK